MNTRIRAFAIAILLSTGVTQEKASASDGYNYSFTEADINEIQQVLDREFDTEVVGRTPMIEVIENYLREYDLNPDDYIHYEQGTNRPIVQIQKYLTDIMRKMWQAQFCLNLRPGQ